jgi:hypothetical protein
MAILFVIMMISAMTWDHNKGDNYVAGIIFLLLIGIFLTQLFRSFVKQDFKIIGEMTIEGDAIMISISGSAQMIFKFSELKDIVITYNGFDGEDYPYRAHGGLSNLKQKNGNYNTIGFSIRNTKNEYEFFLADKYQSIKLFDFLRSIEKKGICFIFKNKFGNDDIYKHSTAYSHMQ